MYRTQLPSRLIFHSLSVKVMLALLLALPLLASCIPAVLTQPFGLSFIPNQLNYCSTRATGSTCCSGRLDDCSRPLLDTLCYCDEFCERGSNSDCCPDYQRVCRNIGPPIISHVCYLNKYFDLHESVTVNCNKCTCQQVAPTKYEVVCEHKPCLISPEIIDRVNSGNYGWKAANYSFLWGKSLEEGYKQRAGICKPDPPVLGQMSVQNSVITLPADTRHDFDARRKWPRLIRSITDQMDYPASWAISAVDVASDRLSIQSKGEQQIALSAQNLISCIHPRKRACASATDRAWWYLSTFGVVNEGCYPYRSGYNGEKQDCYVVRDTWSDSSKCSRDGTTRQGTIYRTPPAYRVNSRENDIMAEIQANGPVQALMHVRSDFFHYKSGIYRHVPNTGNGQHGSLPHEAHRYHAVRIIGWGEERSQGAPNKYWLCANSWGQQWGENGYFRIRRGSDESEIEMFIVGVWARKNTNGNGNGKEYSNYIP